ncbi:MAG: esterase [Enterovirga sp.]|nr:esterase [Enterovirga sp.]
MRKLGSTLSDLVKNRAGLAEAIKSASRRMADLAPAGAQDATPLRAVADFGANPGALEMFTYVPDRPAPSPALVVVLHGCGQTAAAYNDGAGWSALAERHGFVLLFPQQSRANNPQGCFNWFQPGDTTRGQGEAFSIRQMIARAVADHAVDPSRIFVTGLSAGGAMASALLATYPEVFAGGAIIAGLPFRAASNVQEALDGMFKGRSKAGAEWGRLVREASAHAGPWPKVSVWHGDADTIVQPSNAGEIVKQWTAVHGLSRTEPQRDTIGGHPREVWRDATGREIVTAVTVRGMGHGTPLAPGSGEMQGGQAGPFMLDAGISSSHHIARSWGLTAEMPLMNPAAPERSRAVPQRGDAAPVALDGDILAPERDAAPGPSPGPKRTGPVHIPDSVPKEVRAVIEKAFQAAGLMR